MNKEEYQYLDLLKELIEAEPKDDRTGVGTHSVFGRTMRFDLSDGRLPLLTTKKVFYRGAIEEMLFFLRGERDTKKLEAKNINVWKGNTSREFLDQKGLTNYKEGDMGPLYGPTFRDFCGNTLAEQGNQNNTYGIDQLKYVFNEIRSNPSSRRLLMTSFNPLEVDQCVLYPCHSVVVQFHVLNNRLNLLTFARSQDWLLGTPFNLIQAGLLGHIMTKATDLTPGELIYTTGDTHLYKNHIEQAKEQISRSPYDFPTLKINKDLNSIKDIENLKFEDLEVVNYKHHLPIKAPMAV